MIALTPAQPCEVLVQEYRRRQPTAVKAEKLNFQGVGDHDVYNPTAPFNDQGELILAARVEPRHAELSKVIFFHQVGPHTWAPVEELSQYDQLQDPFVTRVHGELVFGGVEVWTNPFQHDQLEYRTVFYRGKRVSDLRLFAVGPQWMKDIRLVELPQGQVGVFTRPNGPHYGHQAQLGWLTLPSLDALTPQVILQAEPLPERFVTGEWGGVNEAYLLNEDTVGVLGHVAHRTPDGHLHYHAMTFSLSLSRETVSPIQVIATRQDFLPGPAKRPELTDVIFSGGLTRYPNGTAHLYVGTSDAEVQRRLIPDPFLIDQT